MYENAKNIRNSANDFRKYQVVKVKKLRTNIKLYNNFFNNNNKNNI